MIAFAGKHPVASCAILLPGQLVVLVIVVRVMAYVVDDPLEMAFVHAPRVFLGLCLAWPLLCVLAISLLRRRSGASLKPLWLLPVLAGLQVYVQLVALMVLDYATTGEILGESSPERSGGGNLGFYAPAVALSVLGALCGVIAGVRLARWFIRTGKWETIMPPENN